MINIPKALNRRAKISYGLLYQEEENLSFNNNYMCMINNNYMYMINNNYMYMINNNYMYMIYEL